MSLQGDLEDIVKAEIPAVFMPHGLGHNLGEVVRDRDGSFFTEKLRVKVWKRMTSAGILQVLFEHRALDCDRCATYGGYSLAWS